MRIAVIYGPMCLLRSAEETWNDPRTGSELGWRRIVEELRKLGHDVEWWANGTPADEKDVVISINEPDSLCWVRAKLRICMFWLNGFSFCKEGFDDHVDIYLSPSEAHRQKAIGDWGAPKPEKWQTNYLGCDAPGPGTGPVADRTSGRVVYCSSPDRGLHRVLESWPHIKARAPHATLHIFYRLEPWLRSFDTTPYFPDIEKNRGRALYIEEALRRLSDPKWGVVVRDQVPHDEMLREMAQAEVLAHPCDPLAWSEGFSCTVLEGCAAQACPVITDADALGEVYADIEPVPHGDWTGWRDTVIRALTDPDFRAHRNAKAKAIAERLTWTRHAKQLEEVILGRIKD